METLGDFSNPENAENQEGHPGLQRDDSYGSLEYGTNNNLEDTAGYGRAIFRLKLICK